MLCRPGSAENLEWLRDQSDDGDDEAAAVASGSREGPAMMGMPHTLVGGSGPVLEAIAALPDDDLLVFRVTGKRPHLRKRPLGAVDAISQHDLILSLYRVLCVDVASDSSNVVLHVEPQRCGDVPLAQLFSSESSEVIEAVLHNFQQWRMNHASRLQFSSAVTQANLSREEVLLLREILDAKAVEGSVQRFDATCLSAEDGRLMGQLFGKGLCKKCPGNDSADGHYVQLALRALDNKSFYLHSPQQAGPSFVLVSAACESLLP